MKLTETTEILKVIKEREKNDNGKRYSIEDLEKIATNKDIVNYIFAVNLLVGNLETMIEDGEFDELVLDKRIKIVEKFRNELEHSTGLDRL